MKKYVCLLVLSLITIQCKSQTKNVVIEDSTEKLDWEELIKEFPEKKFDELLEAPKLRNEHPNLPLSKVDRFFWSDSTLVAVTENRKKLMVDVPKTILKGDSFTYPIGYKPSDTLMVQGQTKEGKDCAFLGNVYPIGKISLPDSKVLLSYSYFEPAERFYFVTMFIVDVRQNKKVGHFGFMYSSEWRYCDNTLEEILKNSEPLSAPIQLLDSKRGFILHDRMVGSYSEDTFSKTNTGRSSSGTMASLRSSMKRKIMKMVP